MFADGTLTFNEMLNSPLPKVLGTGVSGSVRHRDKDKGTHPTQVLHWESFSAEVGTFLQLLDIQVIPACLCNVCKTLGLCKVFMQTQS